MRRLPPYYRGLNNMNKRLMITYCVLVVTCTFAIKWLVVKDEESHATPVKPKPQIKPDAVEIQTVKITAVVENISPEPRKKAEKASKVAKEGDLPKEADTRKAEPTGKPLPEKSKAASNEEKIIKVTEEHKESGLKMLKGDRNVPLILLDFRKIGFHAYLSIMQEMGGRVFVGSGSARKLLAEAVFHDNGELSFVGFKEGAPETEGLAISRPHEIINEGIVETVLASARRSFGGSDLRCVVILPLDSEAAFIGGIAESVAGTGFKLADFSHFEGSYIIHDVPALMIRKGTLKDGKRVPINYTLVLT